MARIVFINGAFGAGKTQAAFELHRRLAASFVFDPEEAGYFIRKCLPPDMRAANFQDHPEWRSLNNTLLRRLTEYDGIVLVPMTIIKPEYFREITERIDVYKHIVIRLSSSELRKRQRKRFEGVDSFAAKMAPECIDAFVGFPKELPDALLLDCDKLTIEETAEKIASECGFELSQRMNIFAKISYRLGVTFGHVR